MQKYSRAIFWFRQDLRLDDNIGLSQCIADSQYVLPVFIFDPYILAKSPDGDSRIGFIIRALEDLDTQLRYRGARLSVYIGDPTELIPQLSQKYNIQAIYTNRSYGYGVHRDQIISDKLSQIGVDISLNNDFLLVEPGDIEYRKVFTPFFRKWLPIVESRYADAPCIYTTSGGVFAYSSDYIAYIYDHISMIPDVDIPDISSIIGSISHSHDDHRPIDMRQTRLATWDRDSYADTRNIPSIDGSSKMSVYIRFGLVSIRQLYIYLHRLNQTRYSGQSVGIGQFISELAWREFWQHIMHYAPETVGLEFQDKRRHIPRSRDISILERREYGLTGYPIVDAAMRQLREEKWMHNRLRMVVASFLTKDMLIDRRLGEQIFAKYLLDYDRNVNIGNRQRSASVGADPKPLRIFNPCLQSKKFDPQAIYIHKYLPELRGVPLSYIHDPVRGADTLLGPLPDGYSRPIVDHYRATITTKDIYMGR